MDDKKFNDLIHNFKKNEKNFIELYNYYFPRICIYIGRRYHDYHFGEDIAQEFFLKLSTVSIPEKINYPTIWIFKACDNLSKTHIAKKGTQILPLYEELVVASVTDEDDYSNLKNGGISEENIEALKELDKLTTEIFVMHFWEGYNYKEIADILGMRHDSIRRKACKGLKKLKDILIHCHTLIVLLSLLG